MLVRHGECAGLYWRLRRGERPQQPQCDRGRYQPAYHQEHKRLESMKYVHINNKELELEGEEEKGKVTWNGIKCLRNISFWLCEEMRL